MWIVLVTKTLMKTKMLVLPNDADVVCPLFQLMHHRRAPATWKWPCVLPSPERAFRISSRRTTETPDYFESASLLLPTAFATRSTCRLTTSPSTVSAIIRLKTTACVILSSGVKQYSGRWGTASPLIIIIIILLLLLLLLLISTHMFYPIAIETAGTWDDNAHWASRGDWHYDTPQTHSHHPGHQKNSLSVSTPVHRSAAGECGLLPQHNEHRIRSRCSRCLTLCLVFTPAVLCWWANNNNNHFNSAAPFKPWQEIGWHFGRNPWNQLSVSEMLSLGTSL